MDDRLKSSGIASFTRDGYLFDHHQIVPQHSKSKDAHMNEELYERFKSKRARWDLMAQKCEKFRAGSQWERHQITELLRKRKAPIVVNLINPAVETLKSMLTSNAPRFNALPREGSDRKTATLFGDIMAYIWQRNRGNAALKEAIDDYAVKGVGWMIAYWDPHDDFGKGEIKIEDIDPFNVYVDPLSKKRDYSDARHMIVAHDWTAEQIMTTFASIKTSFFKDAERSTPDTGGMETTNDVQLEAQFDDDANHYKVIDRYSKRRITMCHYQYGEYEFVVEEDRSKLYEQAPAYKVTTTFLMGNEPPELQYVFEADEVSDLLETIQQFGTVFHAVPEQDEQTGEIIPSLRPGPAVNEDAMYESVVEQMSIGELIAQQVMSKDEYTGLYVYRVLTIGNKEYWKGWTGLTDYPIVGFPNRHKRNPYPFSDVHATMDLQRELNVTRMHIMTHTANTASIKVAMPRGSANVADTEDKLSKAGVAVIEYSPEDGGAPVYMYPPQLPSQLYESEQRFEGTIYEQFGVYPFMGGGGQGGHSTSSGILILDELSQRRISSKRTDIEEGLNNLGRVVIQLIQRHYTEKKTIRLLQPSGRFNDVDLNSPVYDPISGKLLSRINDVTIGAYDLVVASGSTLPTNRMIRMEYFIKLFSQGLIDQYEVLKNVDEVDAEGVMERMGLLSQLQGQVESLMQEVKNLEGDLQTADREAVGAKKRVEVEKFKAKLAEMSASIKANLEVGKERAMSTIRENSAQAGASSNNLEVDPELYDTINQMR